MLQKSVTSRTCNAEHRVDLSLFVRNGIFQRGGNHCSDMQRPALKLRVDILGIFFYLQQAVTRKPCFRRPMFMWHLPLYRVIDLPSVGLDVHCSFTLYMSRGYNCYRS
jgi:hypothetical protein